ncbi:HPF/RaiA family ribosome-associated protein [uncultured Christiangramia sp.]|uniref:HPF/RaiA family ribosome-associated protein n=1 Tax=uncultured Christiangramia sp. TaxID=503836 RepID=UPI0026136794|nr:HPF/RaiA family ribosome-associated protein [uncultured Christiangramia sp.]
MIPYRICMFILSWENDRQGNTKVCEIECTIPGPRIHASASREYFEHAVKMAVKELIKQLEKRNAVIQIV